jgi:hypothetical protein
MIFRNIVPYVVLHLHADTGQKYNIRWSIFGKFFRAEIYSYHIPNSAEHFCTQYW